jgi:hypothetical protein
MKYKFDRNDYARAVTRELQKREKAYPKIIIKKQKQGADAAELNDFIHILDGNSYALRILLELLHNDLTELESLLYGYGDWIFVELIREYKMRIRCYPRFVTFYKSMTQETSDYELSVWKELCLYFCEFYLFKDDPEGYFNEAIKPIRRRKKSA